MAEHTPEAAAMCSKGDVTGGPIATKPANLVAATHKAARSQKGALTIL
ncbi:MAG: hypothetical protein AAGB04_04625 [Pseudomonadota bacterium]